MRQQVVFLSIVLTSLNVYAFGNIAEEEINKTTVQMREQLQDPNYVPTIEDLLIAEPSTQQAVLVRTVLERWPQGSIADCLREVPELRPILLQTFSKDRFYGPYITASSFEPHQRYDRSALNRKLKAELAPELSLDESLFYDLFADEDASVRYDSLKLLIWLDGQRDEINMQIDSEAYHAWISSLLDTALTDTDDKVVSKALRYALEIKASFSMETIESICHRLKEKYLSECINLTRFVYDQEKAVDFLLRQLQSTPRKYDLILNQLEGILSGGQVAESVMYDKIQRTLSDRPVAYYASEKLLRLLKKCDSYKATEYMLAVILSDKSGRQLRLSETLPSRSAYVLVETAVPEDIPLLIDAHKQRMNTWHFSFIGNALVKADDDRYIPAVLEDYVLSDDKRVISDIEKGTGSAGDAVEVLRFALYQTKPEWAYTLLERGILDLNCHSWGSLKSIMVENNLGYGLPILEKRLQKESDPNNARKLRRAIEQLRIRTKDEGRHLALGNNDPYVVRMELRAFAEQPDVSKLADIIELLGNNDPVIAISAVKALNCQPAKFFSVEGIEPELLRSVILAHAGSKSFEECTGLIQRYHVKVEDLPEKNINQCRAMLLSEDDRDVIIAVQCLIRMPIEKGTRSMILSFATEEELHRFLLEHTRSIDPTLAEAIKLCAPPEYGNVILPCITCGQFNLNGRISKRLFPILVKGVVLSEGWHEGTDQLLTRLVELKPELADKLIELSNNNDKEVAVSAARYLMEVWPIIEMTKQQEYLAQCLELSCSAKEQYKTGTEEWIHFNYHVRHEWAGLPKNVKLKTINKHYLDGQLYGEPFVYEGPMARTGNIQVDKLLIGKHSCRMETYYEITVGENVISGIINFPQKYFVIN